KRHALGLRYVTRLPALRIVTMSLEFCTSERKRTSLSRSATSARRWSVTSATTPTADTTRAAALRSGASAMLTSRTVPSRASQRTLAATQRRVDSALLGDVARQRGEILVAAFRVAVPGDDNGRGDCAVDAVDVELAGPPAVPGQRVTDLLDLLRRCTEEVADA